MKEMVHVVGRKHAQKLRVIAFAGMVLLPFAILALSPVNVATTGIAILFYLVGTFASRWLFFAEAEHVVGLYYGVDPSQHQSGLSRARS
jgi:DMSO reductase anchor subunit